MNEDFNSDQQQQENKWEPDTEKYNTTANNEQQTTPKKKKVLWWIPVAAGATVVVIGVSIASVFGISALKNTLKNSNAGSVTSEIQKQIENAIDGEDSTEAETKNTVIINEADSANDTGNDSQIVLTDVSDVVEEVMPSVVAITSRQLVSSGMYGNMFGYYYGNQGGSQTEEVESGTGSGTIVGQNSEEILILTSYHVVEGCSSLYVTTNDGSQIEGYIKDADDADDIAIVAIKIADVSDDTLSSLKIATLSDNPVAVGEGAIVIGNALGYGQSVVTGIISAIDREITVENDTTITVIQTDAAINAGNSGGCLLNSKGEVVGISEAKINSSSVEGMCYAISINHYYDKIIEMLNEDPADTEESTDNSNSGSQSQSSSQSAYIGIQGYDVTESVASSYGIPTGVYVVDTVNGGGAQAAGIQQGDVITGFNGTRITSMDELKAALAKYSAGDTVTITLERYENTGYVEEEVEVTLTAQIG